MLCYIHTVSSLKQARAALSLLLDTQTCCTMPMMPIILTFLCAAALEEEQLVEMCPLVIRNCTKSTASSVAGGHHADAHTRGARPLFPRVASGCTAPRTPAGPWRSARGHTRCRPTSNEERCVPGGGRGSRGRDGGPAGFSGCQFPSPTRGAGLALAVTPLRRCISNIAFIYTSGGPCMAGDDCVARAGGRCGREVEASALSGSRSTDCAPRFPALPRTVCCGGAIPAWWHSLCVTPPAHRGA